MLNKFPTSTPIDLDPSTISPQLQPQNTSNHIKLAHTPSQQHRAFLAASSPQTPTANTTTTFSPQHQTGPSSLLGGQNFTTPQQSLVITGTNPSTSFEIIPTMNNTSAENSNNNNSLFNNQTTTSLPPPTQLQQSVSSSSPQQDNQSQEMLHHTLKNERRTQYQEDQLVEKALLEDSFIEHGILAVDKSVSILGEILNLSEGRDKLFKLLSAILKLTRYGLNTFCEPTPKTRDILERIKSCSTATSNTRLFLKLCTDWVFFRLVIRIWYQQRWGWLKLFTLARLAGMGLYFTFQMPIWLSVTGLVKGVDRNFWQKMSLRSYIISVCSQIFMDFRKVIDLTKEIGYWQLIVPTDIFKQVLPTGFQQLHQHVNNMNPLNFTTSSFNGAAAAEGNGKPTDTAKARLSNVQSKQELLKQQQEDMSYALSFQQRCTPVTSRYQALLNRTIWLQQAKDQVSSNNNSNNNFQHPITQSLNSSADNALNEQLRQLQEETKLALIHENMLQKDRNKLFVNFVKDGGDLFGALDGLLEWKHSDLTLGMISLTSASISLYRMWARYKAAVEKKYLEEEREKIKRKQEEEARIKQEEEFAALFEQLRQQITNNALVEQQQQQQQQQQCEDCGVVGKQQACNNNNKDGQ